MDNLCLRLSKKCKSRLLLTGGNLIAVMRAAHTRCVWQVPARRCQAAGRGARIMRYTVTQRQGAIGVPLMPSHKFHVGDSVTLKRSVSRNVPGGVYEVIKQLPHNGREYEYRIKSANEEHERVAGEGELAKA
jgi:hypothetical protein